MRTLRLLLLCMGAGAVSVLAMGLWMLVLWVEWAATVPRYDNVFDGQLRCAPHARPYTPSADIAAPMREATIQIYGDGFLKRPAPIFYPELVYRITMFFIDPPQKAPGQTLAGFAEDCLTFSTAHNAHRRMIEHHIYGAILTRRIARDIPSDKLVTFYLNEVDFDHDAYGVAAAAQKFLRKRPANLTLGESLALLAMVRGYRLPPYKIMARRDQLLDLLVAQGAISMQAATEAKREIFAPPARNPPIQANDLMQSLLQDIRT